MTDFTLDQIKAVADVLHDDVYIDDKNKCVWVEIHENANPRRFQFNTLADDVCVALTGWLKKYAENMDCYVNILSGNEDGNEWHVNICRNNTHVGEYYGGGETIKEAVFQCVCKILGVA